MSSDSEVHEVFGTISDTEFAAEVGKALAHVVASDRGNAMAALRVDQAGPGGADGNATPAVVVLIGKGLFAEVLTSMEKSVSTVLRRVEERGGHEH